MENNEEIVLVENNETIVPTHEFERVDFNVPATIMSYGDSTVEKIGAILKSTAELSSDEKEIIIDEEKVSKVLDLDSSLDESDKNSNKKELAVISLFKKMFNKEASKTVTEKENSDTYRSRYLEYCKNIEEITEAIRSQRNSAVHDFELKKTIIDSLIPLVTELDEVVIVGKQDLKAFGKELEDLKAKHQEEGGADLYREIQAKTMLHEVFRAKVDELEREEVAYKEQIQAYRLQQGTDLITINSQDSYIKAMAPTLTAQGSIMVFNRIQNRRLKQIEGLNELTNKAITNNAVQLEENAQRGANLYINRGISTETLVTMHDSLDRGFKIYKNARIEKAKKIEEDQKNFAKIKASLETFQTELLTIVDDPSIFEEMKKGITSGPKLTLSSKNNRK